MAKHILSCSFGKDSIATALLALQHGEPLDELVYCEVMFSEEISGELPEHNRFIHETAIPYFEQRGIPTRVLRSEKTYLSCFYHVVTRGKTKGMLSGFPLSGRCTIQRDCKLPPIKAYQKALPPDTVQYIGIAADEPKRLARLKPGQISLLDKYHVAEPETNCQGLFNQIHKNLQKRCQKHRMAPDTSFDRLHFSVQQVFAEIRIVWQLVDIWLPAPLDFGQFQRVGCFQCMIVACHI